MLLTMPNRRMLMNLAAVALVGLVIVSLALPSSRVTLRELIGPKPNPARPSPPKSKYKPTPTYLPPPIRDNFPLVATSTPPPIPKWNQARKDVHKEYDLPSAPPLFVGFTRTWPVLLQAVTSYVTAGWPASQIYVIENTGVQQANARGQLSLQNPFYLNHTVLKALGVNVVTTPTLLSFAQMQNFFLSLTYAHDWPYFFWSHMDVLALSYEDGKPGLTPRYDQEGYKSIYELALTALRDARASGDKWGMRFFAYDHLALVNPAALEDVGGWDTLIPYYLTDCDMHSRLNMRGWPIKDAKAGIITDVASTLEDLSALFRVEGVETKFMDPNPPPPPPPEEDKAKKHEQPKRRGQSVKRGVDGYGALPAGGADEVEKRDAPEQKEARDEDANLAKWHTLRKTADKMFQHKHGDRERNTWQLGQHGGEGEPFYYDPAGFAEALDLITENGREIFRRKWGHRDCDLISGAGRKFGDAWKVEKDY
ncbi:hypothetical protein C8A00DRAFT_14092 [Chaetomidium leptoderma]|uniref:Glycosyl transferase family 8 protein n=1 Tax=Chaetomidium leptoderma TaxID=669021 RepID=A0AAN6ZWQ7_9PEZI|nr:hypothetical protein C8A00DRAFT_14092 [Chaetomidium leptoderma]